MSYDLSSPPPPGVSAWLVQQLRLIAGESLEPSIRSLRFKKQPVPPARVYDGLTIMADGTNWNPGGGQGIYTYYAGAWNRLG